MLRHPQAYFIDAAFLVVMASAQAYLLRHQKTREAFGLMKAVPAAAK
jgi:hypothetical protein